MNNQTYIFLLLIYIYFLYIDIFSTDILSGDFKLSFNPNALKQKNIFQNTFNNEQKIKIDNSIISSEIENSLTKEIKKIEIQFYGKKKISFSSDLYKSFQSLFFALKKEENINIVYSKLLFEALYYFYVEKKKLEIEKITYFNDLLFSSLDLLYNSYKENFNKINDIFLEKLNSYEHFEEMFIDFFLENIIQKLLYFETIESLYLMFEKKISEKKDSINELEELLIEIINLFFDEIVRNNILLNDYIKKNNLEKSDIIAKTKAKMILFLNEKKESEPVSFFKKEDKKESKTEDVIIYKTTRGNQIYENEILNIEKNREKEIIEGKNRKLKEIDESKKKKEKKKYIENILKEKKIEIKDTIEESIKNDFFSLKELENKIKNNINFPSTNKKLQSFYYDLLKIIQQFQKDFMLINEDEIYKEKLEKYTLEIENIKNMINEKEKNNSLLKNISIKKNELAKYEEYINNYNEEKENEIKEHESTIQKMNISIENINEAISNYEIKYKNPIYSEDENSEIKYLKEIIKDMQNSLIKINNENRKKNKKIEIELENLFLNKNNLEEKLKLLEKETEKISNLKNEINRANFLLGSNSIPFINNYDNIK